jgi:hypothetical protein
VTGGRRQRGDVLSRMRDLVNEGSSPYPTAPLDLAENAQ